MLNDVAIWATWAGIAGLAIALEDRFDLCSHCGQLLDFGAVLTQEAA